MTSLAKHWVNPLKNIFICMKKVSRANLLIPWQLAVTLVLPRKIRSKVTRILPKSNTILVRRKATIPASILTKSRKQVLILVFSISITEASKEADRNIQEKSELQGILCIHSTIQFGEFPIKMLTDLNSKVNAMQLSFARKQGLRICKIDINTQKISDSRLEAYEMVIALFQVNDINAKFRFFEKTFLLADININVTFGIFLLILNNVKINCNDQELSQKLYITAKAVFTTKRVELVEKNDFARAALDPKDETLVVLQRLLLSLIQARSMLFARIKQLFCKLMRLTQLFYWNISTLQIFSPQNQQQSFQSTQELIIMPLIQSTVSSHPMSQSIA